jgi:hypothetical protein
MALIVALSQGRVKGKGYSILKKTGKFMPAVIIGMLLLINLLINIHPSSVFRDVRLAGSHEKAIDRVIALIPDEATVTAPYHIFSHLSTRTTTYSPYEPVKPNAFTGEFGLLNVDTDYVIIDLLRMRDYKEGYREKNIDWGNYIEEGNYGLMAYIDGVILLKRSYSDPPIITELNAISGLNAIIYSDEAFHDKVLETQFFPPVRADFPGMSIIPGIVPKDDWSMYLSGYVYMPKDERHEFRLDSDGNALLLIDGKHALYGHDIYPYPHYLTGIIPFSVFDFPSLSKFITPDSGYLNLDLDEGFHKIELYYTEHRETAHLNLGLGKAEVYRYLPDGASLAKSQLVVDEGWAKTKIEIVSGGVERTLITRYPIQQGSIHLDYAEFAPLLSLPSAGFNIKITAELTLDKDSLFRFKAYADDRLVIKLDDEVVLENDVLSAEGEARLPDGRHTVEILYEKPIGEGLIYIEWFVVSY